MTRRIPLITALFIVALAAATGCAPKQQPTPVEKQGFAFWPPAPDAPHVQFLTAINSSKDIAPKAKSGFQDMLYGAEQELRKRFETLGQWRSSEGERGTEKIRMQLRMAVVMGDEGHVAANLETESRDGALRVQTALLRP